MASRAPSICNHPGCGELVYGSYCDKHAKQVKQRKEVGRKSAAKRGYGHKWRKVREGYLAKHPLCAHCSTEDAPVPATELDHITPHKGDMKLFWDRKNWQGLCKSCHSRKTATEDGGWGRG